MQSLPRKAAEGRRCVPCAARRQLYPDTPQGIAMLSSLCPRAHADLILGTCPWCQRRVRNGQPVQEYDDVKQQILRRLRNKFDVDRARGHEALLRGELRKAVQRMATLKAVTLSCLDLEHLVEEI